MPLHAALVAASGREDSSHECRSRRKGRATPWKATARPSVSAPGAALRSVLTRALSSVQVESSCIGRVNVMRAPPAWTIEQLHEALPLLGLLEQNRAEQLPMQERESL